MAGDTEAKFTVSVATDTTAERDETFTVTLSGVSTNAQLAADPTAEGTINDDDTPTSCTLNTGDLWCSVVTVGEREDYYGYNGFYGQGGLSSNRFSVGAQQYTINILSVAGASKEDTGNLTLDLAEFPNATEQEALDKLILHLDNDALRLIESKDGAPGFYYWENSSLDWSSKVYFIARLRRNDAPVFSASTAAREVDENSAAGTDVGDPVTASDDDSDTLTYSLEGTDKDSFAIDSGTGQITTITGVDLQPRGDEEFLHGDGEGGRRHRQRHHRRDDRRGGRGRAIGHAGQAGAGGGDGLNDEPGRELGRSRT